MRNLGVAPLNCVCKVIKVLMSLDLDGYLKEQALTYETGGPELGRIHSRNNDKKFFCHFTGFLEGIAASGYIEMLEVAPLLAECEEFTMHTQDGDAFDIIEDFKLDILEHEQINGAIDVRLSEIDLNCEKSLINRFLGFCRGVVCDGVITSRECQEIINFLESYPALMGVVGVRQIQTSCVDAIADEIVDDQESLEICAAIGDVVGDCYGDTGLAQTTGVANFEEFKFQDFEVEIEGASLVLSGSFKTRPRRLLEDELAARGAIVSKAVSGKTQFVIIGGEASRDWIELNRGTKIRKAQEIRLNSDAPEFVSETQIMRLIGGHSF